MHLAEELGEVDVALKAFLGTHNKALYEHIKLELVDVVTNMMAVASCLGIDLATEMEKAFSRGCPECKEFPCGCWYTTVKSESIR